MADILAVCDEYRMKNWEMVMHEWQLTWVPAVRVRTRLHQSDHGYLWREERIGYLVT